MKVFFADIYENFIGVNYYRPINPISQKSYWRFMAVLLPFFILLDVFTYRVLSGSRLLLALATAISLLLILPTLMVMARRLKSIGRKATELVLLFGVSFIGTPVVLVMAFVFAASNSVSDSSKNNPIITPLIGIILLGLFLLPFLVVGTHKPIKKDEPKGSEE